MAECLKVLSSESVSQEITDVDESNVGCTEESDKPLGMLNECRPSEYYMDSCFDQINNTFQIYLKLSQDFTDVKEVVSLAQVLVGNALKTFLPQSSDKSQEVADGDAAKVVNTSQQSDEVLQVIDVLSAAGAGNLNMANDSEEAEVNCRMKNSHIKIEDGAKIEIEPSETDIGNKSKKSDINFERGPLNLTMEKDSKLTLSSKNKIGNDVSEKAKVDIASKGIDVVLKQKSEMVITEKMNIANDTQQAEVIIKTDHQKFECGEGAKVKLVSGTGGLNTALQQENQVPESQDKLVHNGHKMATAGFEMKETECPVCQEYFKEPKILPCAHLICRICLVNRLKKNPDALCPLCRSRMDDFEDSRSKTKTCDDVADSLPTDEAMSAMVESSKIFNKERKCNVHREANAKSYCLHCNVMLCRNCVKAHLMIPATSTHTIEELSNITLEDMNSKRQPPCPIHPDKTSEFFCTAHNILLCHLCAFSRHRTCPEVKNVNEIFEKYKQLFNEMNTKLARAESDLSEATESIAYHLNISQEHMKTDLLEIDMVCDQIVNSTEDCRKRLKKLVQDADDSMKAAAAQQTTVLRHKHERVTAHQSVMKRIENTANNASLVAMVPLLQARINNLQTDTSLPSNTKRHKITSLTIDKNALSRVEQELAKLGSVVVHPSWTDKQIVWRFHEHHGRNILLTNTGYTAELKDCFDGIVFSSKPMTANRIYEVRVDKLDNKLDGRSMLIGIVLTDPSALHLPLLHSAFGIRSDYIMCNNKWTKSNCGKALNKLEVGSRVGVKLDTSNRVNLYVDGQDQGIVCTDVTQPCYAMIDLYLFIQKITVLPFTSV